ncbi:MAG: ATP-dependent Clp protease ATP-binding subunit [Bacteroidales bacterium]|nr:ATP-dependent Clp protease ATP-binding subunit [Bacteroidales bacterium]
MSYEIDQNKSFEEALPLMAVGIPPEEDTPRENGESDSGGSGSDHSSSGERRNDPLFGKSAKGKKGAQGKDSDTPTLDKYGVWLTNLAKEDKLDPVFGRENELLRIAQILARKRKNNPLLLGEPGTGKTAIVEALAQKIASRDVPIFLLDKRIVSVDLASIVAGSMYRGQFEERMKTMLEELKNNPDIILYIDEIHTLMGGGNSQGGLDAANILKPALSRGEIKVIGATTLEEYRKTIEKDGAMDRRFQKVVVSAPEERETFDILKKLQPRYEAHHHVFYTDDALKAAVKLTAQYVTDRFFPDKAIDAMDEAGAYAHLMNQETVDFTPFEAKISDAHDKKLQAVKDGDYESASRYRDLEKQLQKDLEDYKDALEKGDNSENPIIVGVPEVEKVVSLASGIPVASFTKDDLASLRGLADRLKARVVGQDHVVDAVASAIQRNKIGLRDSSKPIGTFMFLGSSGVGKTHLSKQLARELFGSEDAMIRVDMSEFMERHTVSRLIGAPPGYVGYDQGGELTVKVKRRPYSVILFDEIEKAHPDVHNLLLQLLDDGVLTDAAGGKVNFKNTIIIMTSNVGTKQLNEFGTGIGFRGGEEDLGKMSEAVITKSLRKSFTPEFLNRIDHILTFNALTKEAIRDIVELELRDLQERLDKLSIRLTLTERAKEFVADKGYSPTMGARPLKRAVAKYVEEVLTQAIIDGRAEEGGSYTLDIDEETSGNDQTLKILQPEPALI